MLHPDFYLPDMLAASYSPSTSGQIFRGSYCSGPLICCLANVRPTTSPFAVPSVGDRSCLFGMTEDIETRQALSMQLLNFKLSVRLDMIPFPLFFSPTLSSPMSILSSFCTTRPSFLCLYTLGPYYTLALSSCPSLSHSAQSLLLFLFSLVALLIAISTLLSPVTTLIST